MKRHLFLTGDIQAGKSTLLSKWLSRTECKVSGFFTKKVAEGEHLYVRLYPADGSAPADDNILFDCMDKDALDSDERFNRLGCEALKDSGSADLIVMDEIGFKENTAHAFCEAVLNALNGPVPVIGVLRKEQPRFTADTAQRRAESACCLADEIKSRPDVEMIEVTLDNRDTLAEASPGILSPYAK